MTIRIGAVSYLNTKPLIYGLRNALPECELYLDLPSRLAERLAVGELDVALIPSVEFLRDGRFSIVTDACIACRGPVRSVRLLFRKPPSQVHRLALDVGSRTSAALAQILLSKRYGIRPELVALPLETDFSDIAADALLVIGDRAMKIPSSRYVEMWDLGQQWTEETALPFVFAMWVTGSEELPTVVSEALRTARNEGLKHLSSIVAAEAPRYGLTEDDCLRYFRQQLHFVLGPRERQGLDLFRQYATELGMLPESAKQLSLVPQ